VHRPNTADAVAMNTLPDPDFDQSRPTKLLEHYFLRPDVAAKEIIAALLEEHQSDLSQAALERLRSELQAVSPARMKQNRLKLFANILDRVVDIGKQIGWDMDLLLADFLPHLPEPARIVVARILRCSIVSRTPAKAARKRGAEEHDESSPCSKKHRLC
jgi:hypothetical protein